MKTFAQILAESEGSTKEDLKDLLEGLFEAYVDETGDEDGENYDIGLSLLEAHLSELPESLTGALYETLMHYLDVDDSDDSDDIDEEMLEGLQLFEAASKELVAKLRSKIKSGGKKQALMAAAQLRDLSAKFGKSNRTLTGGKITSKQKAASKKNIKKAARKAWTGKARRTRVKDAKIVGKD